MKENVLIIGGGGREHALAWKLAHSLRIGKLYVAPGNGGTKHIATNVRLATTNIEGLLRFALQSDIHLTVVGPDDALALGIVDAFRSNGLRIFGPTRAAAEIEWSKAYAKNLMRDAGVPTANYQVFTDHAQALAYVREQGVPIVIKASGLALGKGAYPCHTMAKAEEALAKIMLGRVHGSAGNEVVVEEFLDGQEVSIHALCDGTTSVLFPSAQDHKRALDNDGGENTGGMGTVTPLPWATPELLARVNETIVLPTLREMQKRGRPFTGLLYPGIKMTPTGPKVLEYNARFGDPETQSYMRLLRTDLLDVLDACVDGQLARRSIEWRPGFATCITLASAGYPGSYRKHLPISGVEDAERVPGVWVFHAGTKHDGELLTNGGRVLGVTATGDSLPEALKRAYCAAGLIHFDGMHYRRDIGLKAL